MEKKIKSLSWSKINSFENFKSQFIKTYFEEAPFFETKEIIFGKVLGGILEMGSFNLDALLTELSKDRQGNIQELEPHKLKQISETFHRISDDEEFCEKLMNFQFDLFPGYERKLQQFIDGVCCLGFIDNSAETGKIDAFREFKTGKTPWTQERADDHWQLYFYAVMLEEETGHIPKTAYLDWIVTENDENGNIVPTGEIKTFEVQIDPERVKKLRIKIPGYLKAMNEEYEKWLDSQEWQFSLETSKMEEYAELDRQKKEIDLKQKALKKEIDADMQKNKVDTFKLENAGTFYYQQNRKWDYPKKIKNKEAEIQDEMKEKLKEVEEMKVEFEEKNEPQITLSFRFRWAK